MIKSIDILNAIHLRHPDDKWLCASEIRLPGYHNEQRLDALALAIWPSKKGLRHSYEIKISRQDFLNEIKKPEKRQYALNNSDFFWFAVKEGICDKSEIPEEAGLLVYQSNGKFKRIKNAPKRVVEPASLELMIALTRRIRTETIRTQALKTSIPGIENIQRLMVLFSCSNPNPNVMRNEIYNLLSQLRHKGYMDEALKLSHTIKDIQDRLEKNKRRM